MLLSLLAFRGWFVLVVVILVIDVVVVVVAANNDVDDDGVYAIVLRLIFYLYDCNLHVFIIILGNVMFML